MVRDGTYLIGTCAIVTQEDMPLVFQSHLFKIRVHENNLGIDPFVLLAMLESAVTKTQIKAKRVTQDIIDSLGSRVKDLLLPLPRDPQELDEVRTLTKSVVQHRITARQLMRRVHQRLGGGSD